MARTITKAGRPRIMETPTPQPPDRALSRRELLQRRRAAVAPRLWAGAGATLAHLALAAALAAVIEVRPRAAPAPAPWLGMLRAELQLTELEPIEAAQEPEPPREVQASSAADAAPPPPDFAASFPDLLEPFLVVPPRDPPPTAMPRTLPFTAQLDRSRLSPAWQMRFQPDPPREPLAAAPPSSPVAPVSPPLSAASPTPVAASSVGASHPARPVAGACPPPEYPAIARRRHYAGTVTIEMTIDVAGQVTDARVIRSSGHAILDRAARTAALRWRFEPAWRAGRRVPHLRHQPFVFRLETPRSGD